MPVVSQARHSVPPPISGTADYQAMGGEESESVRSPHETVTVPSLSARSRQTGLSTLVTNRTKSSLPSRERVSAAIALVRARQAATASKQGPAKSDIPSQVYKAKISSEKRHSDDHSMASTLTSCTASSRQPDSARPGNGARYKFKLAVSGGPYSPTAANARSPLVPKFQSSSKSETPFEGALSGPNGKNSYSSQNFADKKQEQSSQSGSFIQTVFASRSEVVSQSATTLPNLPSLGDEQENAPDSCSFSRSYAPINARNSSTSFSEANDSTPSMPAAPSLSLDSEEGSSTLDVDTDTLQNVTQFLDKLQKGKQPQLKPVTETPALISNTSDSDEEEDVETDDMNPETLAEIGAFIDAVAKPPIMNPGSFGKHSVQKTRSDISEDDSIGGSDVPAETQKGILDFIESLEKKASMRHILELQASTESKKVDAPDPGPDDHCSTTKGRPIYELLDPVKSVGQQDPPEFNPFDDGREDPPAAPSSNLPEAAPSSNFPEAVLRMRQEEEVAPSYSAESLESGCTFNSEPVSEGIASCEEKKEDDALDTDDSIADIDKPRIDLRVSSSKSSDEQLEAILERATESSEEETDYTAFEEDDDPPSRRVFPATSGAEDYDQVLNSNMPLAPVPECKTDLEDDATLPEGDIAEVGAAKIHVVASQSMESVDPFDDSNINLIDLNSRSGASGTSFEVECPHEYDVTADGVIPDSSNSQTGPESIDKVDRGETNNTSCPTQDDIGSFAPADSRCQQPPNLAEGKSVAASQVNPSVVIPEEGASGNYQMPKNDSNLNDDGNVIKEEVSEETSSVSDATDPLVDPAEEHASPELRTFVGSDSTFNGGMQLDAASVSSHQENIETIEIDDSEYFVTLKNASTGLEVGNGILGSEDVGSSADVFEVKDDTDGTEASSTVVREADDEIADNGHLVDAWVQGSMSLEHEVESVESQGLVEDVVAPSSEVGDKIGENGEDVFVDYDFVTNEKGIDCVDEDKDVFMDQFVSLGIPPEEEVKQDLTQSQAASAKSPTANPTKESLPPKNELLSPRSISKFLAGLQPAEGFTEEQTMALSRMKKLIANVVHGEKLSIIEAAQIRQAAQLANISLNLVDEFLEYAEGQQPEMLEVPTKSSDEWTSDSKFDEIEELDENEAISAFLYRFSALKKGGHLPFADVRGLGEFALPQPNSNEEAVEVDVDYGYVNKQLFSSAREENEEEWWREGSGSPKELPSRKKGGNNLSSPGKDNEGQPNEHEQSEAAVEAVDLTEVDEAVIFGPNAEARKVELSKAKVEVVTPKRKARDSKPTNLSVKTKGAGISNVPSFIFENGEDRGVWLRRNAIASYGSGWDKHKSWLSPRSSANLIQPKPIDGVAAAENLRKFAFGKRMLPLMRPWRLSYEERTREHPGFLRVNVYSLYDAVAVDAVPHELDFTPWEHRSVQQRFLHEQSIGFSRNWFGSNKRVRGNDRYKPPICQPKSMEMPIENIPDPGEWTEEWFTTWKAPNKGPPSGSRSQSYHESHSEESDEQSTTASDGDSVSSSGSSSCESTDSDDDSDDDSWEEPPECGTIVNVQQKIGERVTRVHPDFTSSLRRSRWRRKYFPKGTFPY